MLRLQKSPRTRVKVIVGALWMYLVFCGIYNVHRNLKYLWNAPLDIRTKWQPRKIIETWKNSNTRHAGCINPTGGHLGMQLLISRPDQYLERLPQHEDIPETCQSSARSYGRSVTRLSVSCRNRIPRRSVAVSGRWTDTVGQVWQPSLLGCQICSVTVCSSISYIYIFSSHFLSFIVITAQPPGVMKRPKDPETPVRWGDHPFLVAICVPLLFSPPRILPVSLSQSIHRPLDPVGSLKEQIS